MCSKKVYVDVVARINSEGSVTPLTVIWENGKKFEIDKVYSVQRAYATKVGGTGIRYEISVSGKKTYLFEDEGKWFVEAKSQ
ncbi:MAG: hypothetical protein IJB74_01845 [Clostridia bacterium]|nr:hypothetical protein [Clostridia bacterium]